MVAKQVWTLEVKEDPSRDHALALVRRFRSQLKAKGVTRLKPVPFVSEAVTPYQWRIRGVRVVGYYDLGHFRDEGMYLRADAMERA